MRCFHYMVDVLLNISVFVNVVILVSKAYCILREYTNKTAVMLERKKKASVAILNAKI